jgi:hypothetical protein
MKNRVKRWKIVLGSVLLVLVVTLINFAVPRGRIVTHRFQPVQTNEYNLIFQLPDPEPSVAPRKLPIFRIKQSIQDTPYYLFSNQMVRATNADVLIDRMTNGVRQLRVYKLEAPEWRFLVRRTIFTHLFYRKFWGKQPLGVMKVNESHEAWVSDAIRNEDIVK